MAVFTSKYTGQQVEELLDKATHGAGTNIAFGLSLTTNMNGWNLSNFNFISYTFTPSPGTSYSALRLMHQDSGDWAVATRPESENYLSYMTGSTYIPSYDYEKPANTYLIIPNSPSTPTFASVYKMQWGDDSLLAIPLPFKISLTSGN